MEVWKPIPEFEGVYDASSHGRIRRAGCKQCRKRPFVLSLNRDGSGYLQVGLWIGGKCVRKKVHRCVAAAFIGRSDKWVNHIDGNPSNNRIENLEYVTPRENALHKSRVLGRWAGPSGSRNPRALIDLDTKMVLEMKAGGMSNRAIARALDLKCHKVIGIVVNRRHWSQQ